MPQPIAMQTSATQISVKNSVRPCRLAQPVGSMSMAGWNIAAALAAAWVTMKPMRNPAPVSVTTPTTMPTAAAAAPTASA